MKIKNAEAQPFDKLSKLKWSGWIPLVWYFVFLVCPVLIVTVFSFLSRGTYGGIKWEWTFDNYLRIFQGVYLQIFFESLKLSALTTALCLLLGFPMAWVMATFESKFRQLALILIAIPFLTNLIGRVYALKLFAGYDGPLVATLGYLGFTVDPHSFTHNEFMVMYGMVANYLPFMVLPLFSGLEKFDFTLLEAAADLGASRWTIFTKIILPCSFTSILTGSVMVFVPCLGEFVIPDLLGGAKAMLIGNLITEQFLKSRDWPFGSAISVLLLLVLSVSAIIFIKRVHSGKAQT
jgi:spermidine/putrescine transport system permease protein